MTVIVPKAADKPGAKPKRINPVRPTRAARKKYLAELKVQTDLLKAQTANLSDIIKSGADRAQTARELARLAAESQARIDAMAPGLARSFVTQVDREQKKAAHDSIAKALGVEFASIVDDAGIAADMDMALSSNTSLIRSITSEHWAKVGQAVLDNYAGRPLPDDQSLTQRLRQIGGISERRARLIARDQTSKLTGALNQSRMQAAGIESYVWVTAGDERVVGTPGGPYPVGNKRHMNHYERDGKTFKWSEPPPDGAPGFPINCRCFARPILDPEKLAAKYV